MILETITAAAIVIGSIFALAGSVGLVRLGDVYSRLHAPTKASTLGLGALLLASILHFSNLVEGIAVHEVLVTIFLFLTAPASAHMLARAGLHLGVHSITRPPREQYWDEFPGTTGHHVADDDGRGAGAPDRPGAAGR